MSTKNFKEQEIGNIPTPQPMVHDIEAWKRAEIVDIAAQKALFGLSKMVGGKSKLGQ